MSESDHISQALIGLFETDDNGWFTSMKTALSGLSAAQASFVPAPGFNSVWALVNHVAFWIEVVLRDLHRQEVDSMFTATSEKTGWPPAGDSRDEAAWQAAVSRLLDLNRQLAAAVAELSEEEMNAVVPPTGALRWQILHGVLNHNSYHTCEVIGVRHMQGLWLDRV